VPSPLISAHALASIDPAHRPTLLDVRWQLAGGADRRGYANGHIPGAAFVDLDQQLSSAPGPRGRHPLPDAEAFAADMRATGVSSSRAVVVYDEATSMAAARAWWLLRYFGHPQVAVLDGGLAAWVNGGNPVESGRRAGAPDDFIPGHGDFVAKPGAMPVLDVAAVAALAKRAVLIDARAPERFRGFEEPIDPVAGHIPGARNRPTSENVDESGKFLEPDVLRAAFRALGVRDGGEVGAYCGSGITAAHEVLALEIAGYPRPALYPGSWSEWITDPGRPVARDV
jgi:thiosulfate/3-mercaptopyruvate sulfurtransferase